MSDATASHEDSTVFEVNVEGVRSDRLEAESSSICELPPVALSMVVAKTLSTRDFGIGTTVLPCI